MNKNNSMRRLWLFVGFLILCLLPIPSSFSEEKKGRPKAMIMYKPPLRGIPIGRMGGGTRGADDNLPTITALVPDHIGLTMQEQPSLYWHLSSQSTCDIEFTLIDDVSIQPLLATRLEPPVAPGIHVLKLKDHGIHLSKGNTYKWFVALVPDPEQRSKDIIAGGIIERVDVPPEFQQRLEQADDADVPNIYAESGIWYDTISAISNLIDKAPENEVLRQRRGDLLEQVGLGNIR